MASLRWKNYSVCLALLSVKVSSLGEREPLLPMLPPNPYLQMSVILVEDLCGRVSACYNEGMVTPVIARRFLSTNKHTARGTVWKTVGRASFPGSARPTLSAVTFHYADILQTYLQAFNIFRRYGSMERLAQRFTNSSC